MAGGGETNSGTPDRERGACNVVLSCCRGWSRVCIAGALILVAGASGCRKASEPDAGVPSPAAPTVPTTPAVATLSAVALSAGSISGDGTVTGTASLSSGAPSGGALVGLSSSDSAASVPTSVSIPAGAASATFVIRTFAPSSTRTAVISAAYGGVTRTASLVVEVRSSPPPGPMNLTGRWRGTLVCTICGPTSVAFQMDITQAGSAFNGSCVTSTGASGGLTLRLGATEPNGEVDLFGNCAGGSLDLRYRPSDDTLSLLWRVDYSGRLTR